MMKRTQVMTAALVCLIVGVGAMQVAFGNGGPFVVKSPSGDPAAKGVLARLDPTLKPARETRLRVVKEDLAITFNRSRYTREMVTPPLAIVTAAYTIENPTDKEVMVDFGFPILHGIFINPYSMMPRPDVQVTVDQSGVKANIISNSVIYGIIRQNAREAIEKGIAADPELVRMVSNVRGKNSIRQPEPTFQQAQPAVASNRPVSQPQTVGTRQGIQRSKAVEALRAYLTGKLEWNARDAELMVQYLTIEFGPMKSYPRDRWSYGPFQPRNTQKTKDMANMVRKNLGPLSAIGEQKTTQFFAQLASQFDQKAASTYEAIFKAWGGDVKEQSVDLKTGEIRPRELNLTPNVNASKPSLLKRLQDPTVYARVDYLDENAKLTDAEKSACKAVLKNLQVVFTFAPMNLLHYQVTFQPGQTRAVTVKYSQYAYVDTKSPASYQLAYVVHPASLWDDFGPINLDIRVPKGIPCRASTTVTKLGESQPVVTPLIPAMVSYGAKLVEPKQKTGELFIAIDRTAWDAQFKKPVASKPNVSPKTASVPLQPKK